MNHLLKKVNSLDTRKNEEQLKLEFYSVVIGVILSTDLFKKNKDLKVLFDEFKVEIPLKDYLYDSRTALLARVIREIESSEKEILAFNIRLVREFMDSLETKKPNEITDLINKYSRNKVGAGISE